MLRLALPANFLISSGPNLQKIYRIRDITTDDWSYGDILVTPPDNTQIYFFPHVRPNILPATDNFFDLLST